MGYSTKNRRDRGMAKDEGGEGGGDLARGPEGNSRLSLLTHFPPGRLF